MDDYFGIAAVVGIIGSIFLLFLGEIPLATYSLVMSLHSLYLQDRKG